MFPNQFRWISSASIEIMYKFLEISISKFLNIEKKTCMSQISAQNVSVLEKKRIC